jgi:hypothetical protein
MRGPEQSGPFFHASFLHRVAGLGAVCAISAQRQFCSPFAANQIAARDLKRGKREWHHNQNSGKSEPQAAEITRYAAR